MKNIQTIYIFGNLLLDFDNLPIRLLPQLQKKFPGIKFIEIDPNENLKPIDKKLVLIDTVINTERIIIIDSIDTIDKIATNPNVSMHDFDLGFNLKLLKKIGELEEILIFGVPPDMDENTALVELSNLIKKHL